MLERKQFGPSLDVFYLGTQPIIIVHQNHIAYYSYNILAEYTSKHTIDIARISLVVREYIEKLKESFGHRSVELLPNTFNSLYKIIKEKNVTSLLTGNCLVCNGKDICYCTQPYIERKIDKSISPVKKTSRRPKGKTTDLPDAIREILDEI